MMVSLNEVEAMTLKGVRGAGFSWGIAEDAGKAMRWLAAEGLPWLPALVARLDRGQVLAPPRLPMTGNRIVAARAGVLLCPLLAGVLISDLLHKPPPSGFEVNQVAIPLLLVPFIARTFAPLGGTVHVSWMDKTIELAGARLLHASGLDAAGVDETANVGVAIAEGATTPSVVAPSGVAVDAALWARLDTFAMRTYVPEGELSRRLGAGANLDDND